MPSVEFERELRGMGLSSEGIVPCPKCRRPVEKWGKYLFNPADHATDPLVMHLASCGQREEEVPELPPVPVQMARVEVEAVIGVVYEAGPPVAEGILRTGEWYRREYERLMRERGE